MKKYFAAVLLASFGVTGTTHAGIRDVGNGGDVVVLEFKNIARKVATTISSDAHDLFPEFTPEKLQAAVDSVQVVSLEKVFLGEVEKDAVNIPEQKLIQVSRSRWLQERLPPSRIRALVFHEYLGILGVADEDFKVSGRLAEFYDETRPGLIPSDVRGRIIVRAPMDPDNQGEISVAADGATSFQGVLHGEVQSCKGTSTFSAGAQLLSMKLRCPLSEVDMSLDFWETEPTQYLRKMLFDVVWSHHLRITWSQNTKPEAMKLYKQKVDGKHASTRVLEGATTLMASEKPKDDFVCDPAIPYFCAKAVVQAPLKVGEITPISFTVRLATGQQVSADDVLISFCPITSLCHIADTTNTGFNEFAFAGARLQSAGSVRFIVSVMIDENPYHLNLTLPVAP